MNKIKFNRSIFVQGNLVGVIDSSLYNLHVYPVHKVSIKITLLILNLGGILAYTNLMRAIRKY